MFISLRHVSASVAALAENCPSFRSSLKRADERHGRDKPLPRCAASLNRMVLLIESCDPGEPNRPKTLENKGYALHQFGYNPAHSWVRGFQRPRYSAVCCLRSSARVLGSSAENPSKGKTLKSPPIRYFSEFSRRAVKGVVGSASTLKTACDKHLAAR